MNPHNLNPSPLESPTLHKLAMNPAIARLRGRALAARFTTHFIA